jgi:hypothetical protein
LLTAPSGFSAPTDTFKVGAGDDDYRTVSMNTGTSGYKSGDLTVSSNDLDHPTSSVALLGTVLAHASPSLSASGIDLVDTLDFGSASGGFPNQYFDVYNDGYGALQAVLEVYDAGIVGGDGRFSFVGGFAQADVGADPAEYEMTFDGSGAAADSLYTAVLTLSTRDDQDVPGAGNLDDLVLHLHAYVDTGTSVPDHVVSALSLSPGVPNPFTRETSLALALPEPAQVQLRVYDVSGRLVRILLSGEMPAGVHEVRWDGKDDTGRPTAAGIYFLTAEVGDWREARKLILLR